MCYSCLVGSIQLDGTSFYPSLIGQSSSYNTYTHTQIIHAETIYLKCILYELRCLNAESRHVQLGISQGGVDSQITKVKKSSTVKRREKKSCTHTRHLGKHTLTPPLPRQGLPWPYYEVMSSLVRGLDLWVSVHYLQGRAAVYIFYVSRASSVTTNWTCTVLSATRYSMANKIDHNV